jgi:energy-converting hydrogenase Eha subunit E
MFERFSRSWTLIKASATVLKQDKELLLFPALSAIATLLVVACFALPLFGLGALDGLTDEGEGLAPMAYVLAFLFYLAQYFVIFFFNTALVGAAMIRLDGGDPTVRDGLRIAASKVGPIFGYALIAATVGMLLRALQERAGWIGRWVAGLIGMAWTVASFLVVPVLVSREIGPIQAVKESAFLLKKTWGENVIGQGGIGLSFMLINALIVAVGVALIFAAAATQSAVVIGIAVALMVIGLLVSALIQAALSGIYSAALYRFASGDGETQGFDGSLLQHAFAAKR